MSAWLLLLLTIGAACLTYNVFRWSESVGRGPFGPIAGMWKQDLSHLPLAEQDKRKEQMTWIAMRIFLFFLAATIGLAVVTVRAFASGGSS
jgi:hypothetical protein